jgi:hypothetical protein
MLANLPSSLHAIKPQHVAQTRQGEGRLASTNNDTVIHLAAQTNQNMTITSHMTATITATPAKHHCRMTAYLGHINQRTPESNVFSRTPYWRTQSSDLEAVAIPATAAFRDSRAQHPHKTTALAPAHQIGTTATAGHWACQISTI